MVNNIFNIWTFFFEQGMWFKLIPVCVNRTRWYCFDEKMEYKINVNKMI